MKTWKLALGIVAIVLALGTVGVAFAQGPTQPTPQPTSDEVDTPLGFGRGRGSGMGWGGRWDGHEGPLHEAMIETFAEALDISEEDLEARLEAGETMAQIAQSQGLSLDEFRDLWVEAREKAIAAALEDGSLTQEQADWMLDHMGGAGPNAGCPMWGGDDSPVGRGPGGRFGSRR